MGKAKFEDQLVDRVEGGMVVKTLPYREAVSEIADFTQLDETAILIALNRQAVFFPGGRWEWSQSMAMRKAG
jgi:hypothetical protein